MTNRNKRAHARAGFTLIELLVVVLIIGILAAVAVPQYFKVVEKGRFSEAMSVFSTLKGGQERYLLKNNSYAANVSLLDVGTPALKHYVTPTTMSGAATSWSIVLVRAAAGAPGGSTYNVTYTGPAGTMVCGGPNAALCTSMLP
jgi:prepilin-type N-terminal cleavage/methylation domain-containing protein